MDPFTLILAWLLLGDHKGGGASQQPEPPPVPPPMPPPPPGPPPPMKPGVVFYPEHVPSRPGDHMCPTCDALPDFKPGITAADVSDDDPRSPNYEPTSPNNTPPLPSQITARMLPPDDPRSAFAKGAGPRGASPPPAPPDHVGPGVAPGPGEQIAFDADMGHGVPTPPFPSGWERYPGIIPAAVRDRATQLLPSLLAGTFTREIVGGQAITFQAQPGNPLIAGSKVIVAWRIRGAGVAPGLAPSRAFAGVHHVSP